MGKVANTVGMIALAIGAMSVTAATFDGSIPLICASQVVNECVVGKHCDHVTPASINLPDFFNVDVKGKLISGSGAKTLIERVEHLDGKLILQGADGGAEGVRGGLGWTMAIDEVTGKMSISAAGDGFAIVVFGACTDMLATN